jgi:AraC-like DNA-binding protein
VQERSTFQLSLDDKKLSKDDSRNKMKKVLIRSRALSHYAEIARRAGLDPYRLVSEFRLPQRCLEEPELKIPLDLVRQLLEASAQRSGEEAFGLRMAEARRQSDLGPLGLLVREQATLRLALDLTAQYSNRIVEGLFLTVEEHADVVILREELILGRAGPVRQITEYVIGQVFRMLRTFTGPVWSPLRVCFVHDAPADRSVHGRVFGRNVEFGRDFNGIVCARSDLDVANPNADPEIARLARRMLVSDVKDEPRTMSNQVHELILMQLGSGSCTIKGVARHLGIDPRTIQRHLGCEGGSFSAILESVRRELAGRYLKERHRSIAEISSLLGFSATSGFSRWYRQKFRVTPSAGRVRVPSGGVLSRKMPGK